MRSYKIVLVAALAVAMLAGFTQTARKPRKAGKKAMQTLSQLSPNSAQARLWENAAQTAATAGLEQVPVVARPVQTRKRMVVSSQPIERQPVGLPAGQQTGIRVAAAPELREKSFSGKVRVQKVEGERLELDLGQQRLFSIFVRVGGRPMRLKAGERVDLLYRVSDDPFARRLTVAIRAEGGDGIISILEGGAEPVTVRIPLFKLEASQVGQPQGGRMRVEVRVGEHRRVLEQGQIVEFPESGLTVGLTASLANVGADAYRAEGNPYAIRLVAWTKQ